MSSIEPQSVVGFLNAEEDSGRREFNLPEERGRQGGTVAERYQGGVASPLRGSDCVLVAPAVRRCGQRS